MTALLSPSLGHRSQPRWEGPRKRRLILARFLTISVLLLAGGREAWASGNTKAELRAFEIEEQRGACTITICVHGPVSYRTMELSNPPRFVLDFESALLRTRSKQTLDSATGVRSRARGL